MTLLATCFFARMILAALGVVCATFLAYHGREGWGWVLFVTVLVTPKIMGEL